MRVRREDDTSGLVGDLVNKGPLSVETVRFARASGFACVRGNHDASALDAWIRRRAGGDAASPNYAYMDGLTDDEVTFLRELPFTLRLVDTSTLIVHAGVVPGVPLEEQEPEAMCTMRKYRAEEHAELLGTRLWC